MTDDMRQLRILGWKSLVRRLPVERRLSLRARRARWVAGCEQLEPRELLSTIQNFTTPGTQFALDQIGALPAPSVIGGGPSGVNFLRLATASTSTVLGNNNSISFVTSDPGTFNQVTANWDFRVTPTASGTGVGMSFALLNTTNFGTSGQASSVAPQNGIYDGSLAFGFDTQKNTVNLSLSTSILDTVNLTPLGFSLTSGLFIHATALINFQAATVSLSLTPDSPPGAPTTTVFSNTPVTGLSPYQSRVGFQAENSTTLPSFANFDLTNIDVEYSGSRLPGTISFQSSSFTALDNQGTAPITVVRNGGSAGTFSVVFVSADGTARNGVNYTSFTELLTFADGVSTPQTVSIPIFNNHLFDGNKTVNLYISDPTFAAPLASPITATLTIINTNAPPPTVSSHVGLVFAPHTRRVTGFRLQFSQAMDPTSSQNLANYEVLLPPARPRGQARVVPLSNAALDSSGQFVTLTRANSSQHLTNRVQIIVRGRPTSGLGSLGPSGTFGTFLAGTRGVSGTDASLLVSI
jgi:hypothetical protein